MTTPFNPFTALLDLFGMGAPSAAPQSQPTQAQPDFLQEFFDLFSPGPEGDHPEQKPVNQWDTPRDPLAAAIMAPFEDAWSAPVQRSRSTPGEPRRSMPPPAKLGAPASTVSPPEGSVAEQPVPVPELEVPDGMAVDMAPPDVTPPPPVPDLTQTMRAHNGPKLRSITEYAGLSGDQPGTFPVSSRFNGTNVQPALRDRFTLLQNAMGEPLNVSSVYRSRSQNAAAGGARGSQHLHGNAVDVDVRDWPVEKRIQFIEKASAEGFTGIGVGANSIHIDLGGRRAWGYKTSAGGGPVPSWARKTINKHLAGDYVSKKPTQVASATGPIVTAYSPQKGGDKMEGGYASSRRGPDGKFEVRTLADVAAGNSEYITLAGDSSQYGKEYTIPEITYLDATGNAVTLKDVRGVVHDTGSAFRGKGTSRFDIPVDRDIPSLDLGKQPFSKKRLQFIPR